MRFVVVFLPILAVLGQARQAEPPATPLPRSSKGPNFAVLTRKVDPQYTAEARAAGLQGDVSLYVEVDRDGRPSQVNVMEGLGLGLDQAAVKAVEQWEFQPKRGAPNNVQDMLEIDIPFRLDPPAPWSVESERYRVSIPEHERVREVDRPVLTRYVAPAMECSAPNISFAFTIGKDGTPRVTQALEQSGFVQAIESWRFQPAKLNGKTAEAQGWVDFACQPPAGFVEKEPSIHGPGYRTSASMSPPVLLAKTEPEYSELARKSKLQGATTLYIQISPQGKPTQMHVIHRLGMGLDQKAMEAVKHWKFSPGMKEGKPVTVEATIEVNFRLL